MPAEDTRFGIALARAVQASGLALGRISYRLAERGHRVSDTTLSNWQRGQAEPSRTSSLLAIADLELLLGLGPGPGELSGLLTRNRRRQVPSDDLAEPLVPDQAALQRLRERVGLDLIGGFDILGLHEHHRIGDQRAPVEHRTRQVIRASRNAVTAHHFFFLTRDGVDAGEVSTRVLAGPGCRTGRTLTEPPDMACTELTFPRPLDNGETHLFSYSVVLDYGRPPEPEFRRALRKPAEQMVLQVSFHEDARPTAIYACRWPGPTVAPTDVAALRLDAENSAHHVLLHPGTGIYGLRWEWNGTTG